jgi:hypothetical protein
VLTRDQVKAYYEARRKGRYSDAQWQAIEESIIRAGNKIPGGYVVRDDNGQALASARGKHRQDEPSRAKHQSSIARKANFFTSASD